MAKCQWLMAILVFKDHHFHHQLLGACFHYASLHPPNQLNFGLIFIALQKMPLTSKQCQMLSCWSPVSFCPGPGFSPCLRASVVKMLLFPVPRCRRSRRSQREAGSSAEPVDTGARLQSPLR